MIVRDIEYLKSLVKEIIKLPNETEWIEFKHNNDEPQMIGEYISAIANSTALNGKINGYMIWGVDDKTHELLGTTFRPSLAKKGNQELENWLLGNLEPKIDFRFYEIEINDKNIVLLEIDPAYRHPVKFNGIEYIRVGSYKRNLKDLSEKERELWRVFDKVPFEKQIAVDNINSQEVLNYLEYTKYFELLKLPLPENKNAILEALISENIVNKLDNSNYAITNLGAILFAKNLSNFQNLKRKAIRVIQYKDNTKFHTIKEQTGNLGYAVGFEGLVKYINDIIPSNEVIGQAFRENVAMYPELSIRELVANAIIHQDFLATGSSVMIEIYKDRFEVTNPGTPLIDTDRFLDSPPKSRNEALASFMRRIGICEERGSGVDKIVMQTELYQLPAPIFRSVDGFTMATLFAHKELKDMNKDDKIRACYMHCVLRYTQNDYMTNTSLRERFNIDSKNTAMVSRIIKDALDANKIVLYDENVGTKARTYIPSWAK
ncbi:ATP-binding protein [Aliarcobacter cryaerophilus]|uniref:ATP-binding protein n=1 Tax=Aliarcobacter cryaerophilus TaxID=28198 RepID=UPI0021B3928B|nr:ATP-binding protein [Aliarcobacter cryaerophilus]MCT7465680.1 putative DNA binding domain-containing protein [Aliarcobacter cryaerophilus]MCT7485377.1 putative DNA binding domain-containing protein [Aliarcobacter cryaerophilus]MCT7491304.1 putative DNA binding domain-containing protein [Aliarcobacter cryaerophilus]MCT7494829.1 putative DNA binding domain-containing protein [Aliarcobacter cryaerophilus]MCT7524625.1 putative DNA binding domain-containing protein [Aliarcobacter cryaerophilus]